MPSHLPQLSIIIPALNEKANLPQLIDSLLQQQKIELEIIIVDGGSRDGSKRYYKKLIKDHPNIISLIESDKGRALQMNSGADYARAPDLLFLHADTVIRDTLLLSNGLKAINLYRSQHNKKTVAGHFGLRFIRSKKGYDKAYYFYEAKTHLNRNDTINGDQGFLISKDFLKNLGKFDESLSYMEDARLATKIFKHGSWINLPGVVHTSARRFESEGFKQRQILNSFLCNFESIGLYEFFELAKSAYQSQDSTSKLQLIPFLKIIHRMMKNKGVIHTLKRWYQTGGCITDNAWQLAFSSDCKKAQLKGIDPGQCSRTRLAFYDNRLAWLITSPPCRAITGLITFAWFYSMFITER